MLWAEKNWDEKYLQSLSKVFQLFGQLLLLPASCFLICLGGLLLEQWERCNYSSTEAPLAGACLAMEPSHHNPSAPSHNYCFFSTVRCSYCQSIQGSSPSNPIQYTYSFDCSNLFNMALTDQTKMKINESEWMWMNVDEIGWNWM